MLNVIIYGLISRFEANGVVTLFFYFFHVCASGSSVLLGILPSPSTGFNVMTNFSDTRLMEFHQSVWFFRYQTDVVYFSSTRLMKFHWSGHWNFKTLCIPPLWVWIEVNCIFGLWDTSAMDFNGKNWKNLSKNHFSTLEIDAFWRITHLVLVKSIFLSNFLQSSGPIPVSRNTDLVASPDNNFVVHKFERKWS